MFPLLHKLRKRVIRKGNRKRMVVRIVQKTKERHKLRTLKTYQRTKMVILKAIRLVVVLIWPRLVKNGKKETICLLDI